MWWLWSLSLWHFPWKFFAMFDWNEQNEKKIICMIVRIHWRCLMEIYSQKDYYFFSAWQWHRCIHRNNTNYYYNNIIVMLLHKKKVFVDLHIERGRRQLCNDQRPPHNDFFLSAAPYHHIILCITVWTTIIQQTYHSSWGDLIQICIYAQKIRPSATTTVITIIVIIR